MRSVDAISYFQTCWLQAGYFVIVHSINHFSNDGFKIKSGKADGKTIRLSGLILNYLNKTSHDLVSRILTQNQSDASPAVTNRKKRALVPAIVMKKIDPLIHFGSLWIWVRIFRAFGSIMGRSDLKYLPLKHGTPIMSEVFAFSFV